MAKFSLLQTSKELSALKMVDSSLSLSHMNMNASLNNRSFFLCDLDVAFQRQFQRDLDIFSTLIMTPFSGITCEDTAQYIIGNLDNLNFLPAQTLSSAFLAQKWEISKLLDYDQSQTILKILLHLSLDERVFFTYFDELKCAVCFFTALLSKVHTSFSSLFSAVLIIFYLEGIPFC